MMEKRTFDIGDIVMIPEDDLFNMTIIDILNDRVALCVLRDGNEVWFDLENLDRQTGVEF